MDRWLQVALLFVCFLSTQFASAQIADCTEDWEVFSSEPYEEIYFPDTNVAYWRYRFELSLNQPKSFKISGTFPRGRFTGFNLYRQRDGNSLAGLSDFEIQPDPDDKERFTVFVAPHGIRLGANQISLPEMSQRTEYLEIWFRIYVPANANQEPPRIQAVDSSTGDQIECPVSVAAEAPSKYAGAGQQPPPPQENSLSFFKPREASLFANKDTTYLATRLKRTDVTVVKFRAPTFSRNLHSQASDNSDVRYWSLCMGGIKGTTSQCLADANAKVQNGWATLVVGPESLRSKVEQAGYNFMPWDEHVMRFLIYRNLIPREGFSGAFKLVPTLPHGEERRAAQLNKFAAHLFIGEYAPVGRQCDLTPDFLKTLCGLGQ